MKAALITGATGQDGAYLARLLLQKHYRVYAGYRRTSSPTFWRFRDLGLFGHERLTLVEHDLLEGPSTARLLQQCRPQEVYNLGAQSFVGSSFEQPSASLAVNAGGNLTLLESIRNVDPSIRFYQASSAEMFGKAQEVPQNEATPFHPRSPYGVSKACAHWMTVNYREAYALFACSGILFNHESPLRGRDFVTRRISEGAAAARNHHAPPLKLGNLSAQRDWGYAPEFVEGMWRMLQADAPDSFVLATGRTASVRDFATLAFAVAGLEITWEGSGLGETGFEPASGRVLVTVDPALYRPCEVDLLVGDSSKARRVLGWSARKTLEGLCALMVRADIERMQRSGPPPRLFAESPAGSAHAQPELVTAPS